MHYLIRGIWHKKVELIIIVSYIHIRRRDWFPLWDIQIQECFYIFQPLRVSNKRIA